MDERLKGLDIQINKHIKGLDIDHLVAASKKHVAFLRACHKANISLQPPSKTTLQHYEAWLASKALEPPPLDCAWVWHCHRLAPLSYARTAARLGLPDAKSLAFRWTEAATDAGGEPGALVLDGFDVVASCARQKTFLWQVSGERYEDESFLRDGAARYEHFLRLMRRGEFLVPTYQIDLFWHTHILDSGAAYAADTARLGGFVLPHDDSVNDRSTPETKLNVQFRRTCALWAATRREAYAVDGAMYRGEPPLEYGDADWLPVDAERAELRWRLLREAMGGDEDRAGGGAPSTVDAVAVPVVDQVAGDMAALAVAVPSRGANRAGGWECADDAGGWIPYDAASSAAIDQAEGQGAGSTATIRIGASTYAADPWALTQTNVATGFRRAIRRNPGAAPVSGAAVVSSTPPTFAYAPTWSYKHDGAWCAFDGGAQASLEQAFRAKPVPPRGTVHLPATGATSYIVDLDRWTQTNAATGTTRRVHRAGLPWWEFLGDGYERYDAVSNAAVNEALLAGVTGVRYTGGNGQTYAVDLRLRRQVNVATGVTRQIREAPDFIAAADRKTVARGTQANPLREGYVFGAGASGDGYYRIGTALGDALLRTRLESKLTYAKGKAKTAKRMSLVYSKTTIKKRADAVEERGAPRVRRLLEGQGRPRGARAGRARERGRRRGRRGLRVLRRRRVRVLRRRRWRAAAGCGGGGGGGGCGEAAAAAAAAGRLRRRLRRRRLRRRRAGPG
ncbi:hypothetical protein JL722_1342 [Aureococcus anophagefferens]|nr:hypothetical protein JL722_1342 [Aureococcus anophagefferens]